MSQVANLPVLLSPVAEPRRQGAAARPRAAAFDAQLLGQDGRRRGLKGGGALLEQANSAYCGAAWSGRSDRRTPTGEAARLAI